MSSEVTVIMERLAARDGAALFSLIDAYRPELVRTVRSIAAARRARLSAEQVDDLVIDAALAIAEVAEAWSPEGAPPWFYARGRIAAAVDRLLGQWADPLVDDAVDVEQPPWGAVAEPATAEVMARLAEADHLVALLRDGLEAVASLRDQLVYVEHRIQVALGDPSPAVTIARLYDMQPEAVRQQTRRIKLRLRHLAETDPRFAALATIAVAA